MFRHYLTSGLSTALTVVGVLLIWEIGAAQDTRNLFPGPRAVAAEFQAMFASGDLTRDVTASFARVAIGYAAGSGLGVLLGLLTGRSHVLSRTLGLVFHSLRSVPALGMLPFAVLWLGTGETAIYFLIAWGVFFPVWVAAHVGVQEVDQRLIWAAQSFGASRWRVFWDVLVPGSLGHIVGGMRSGIGLAFLCVVAAEMAGANSGLGFRVEVSHLSFRSARMAAALVSLGVLGAATDTMFAFIVSRLAPWQMKHGGEM